MSWTIMDGMRLMFQRVQELDLKELPSDACRHIEEWTCPGYADMSTVGAGPEDQGGGAPAEDARQGSHPAPIRWADSLLPFAGWCARQ
jgi:hypothetical protein